MMSDMIGVGQEQRILIARAQGMLMERYGLDDAKALRMLVWLAQQNQVEIAVVAEHFLTRSSAPLPSSCVTDTPACT